MVVMVDDEKERKREKEGNIEDFIVVDEHHRPDYPRTEKSQGSMTLPIHTDAG